MRIGDYRLLEQIDVGPEGSIFEGRGPEGPVEIRLATERAWDAERLRICRLLTHSTSRSLLHLDLDRSPAAMVLERVARQEPPPVSVDADLLVILADGLAEGHRLGLVHGHLGPDSLFWSPEEEPKLDWTKPPARTSTARPLDDVADLARLFVALRLPEESLPEEPEAFRSRLSEAGLEKQIIDVLCSMLADPLERPLAADIPEQLEARQELLETRVSEGPTAVLDAHPDRLGRYVLLEELGQGGMGCVFRARDEATDRIVALKLLIPERSTDTRNVRRFMREAHLLSEFRSPYVANLLEANQDAGRHYLVMEYVPGRSLKERLRDGPLPEREAASLVADVARALAEAHERGLVHRDVKPENILLLENGSETRVKLCDFGLARNLLDTETTALTRADEILGTPLYMAPEQFPGEGTVDVRADVYALGATLFHLLTGHPPFEAKNLVGIVALHQKADRPPDPRDDNPSLSGSICRILERALALNPAARYPDAGRFLEDLERHLRGEPADMWAHPRLPNGGEGVQTWQFEFDLDAPPDALWPHVSNTERFNRAIGLDAVEWTSEETGEGTRPKRFGSFRTAGVRLHWEEHPFEWIEGRRFGVLREYTSGPFEWFVSTVELTPRSGRGTTLAHTIHVKPKGLLGRAIAGFKIGFQTRSDIERVYRRIDAACTGQLPASADPFEQPRPLPRKGQERLRDALNGLAEEGFGPDLLNELETLLTQGAEPELARIRPLTFARKHDFAEDAVLALFFAATDRDILSFYWDILCPRCRISSGTRDTLRELESHGHCEACNLDFKLNLARSIELVFRISSTLRSIEVGTYCIGGPGHSPHVVAQIRLAPDERFWLDLTLGEGTYHLGGPALSFGIDFRVFSQAPTRRWDISLSRGPDPDLPRSLKPGEQRIGLLNDTGREQVVRLERTAGRPDALTADRVAAHPAFRERFPEEILQRGQLLESDVVTFLSTELAETDLFANREDTESFRLLYQHFQGVSDAVQVEGGTFLKTVGTQTLSVFRDPLSGLKAALHLADERPGSLPIHLRLHRGPALVATLNDRLDYFGRTVETARRLLAIESEAVCATEAVLGTSRVGPWLKEKGVHPRVLEDLPPRVEVITMRLDRSESPGKE